jgi:ribosomal protein S18 acetylase RimI-like enzyme
VFSRDGIEYGLVEEAEVDAMASLLAGCFSRFEPMAVALGLPYDEIQGLVKAFGPKALSEQLTIVAREVSTGRPVGALLTDDFGTPAPDGLEAAAPTFAPVGALLDGLDESYRATHSIQPGTHLHLFMVGVAEDMSSRGIARHLVTACLANGKGRGYRTAVTEATGAASQRVFRKCGFEELLVASYQQFAFNEQRVFSGIVEPEGAALMVRDL